MAAFEKGKGKGKAEPFTEGAQFATPSGTRQRNARHKARDSQESAGTATSQATVQEIAPWKRKRRKERTDRERIAQRGKGRNQRILGRGRQLAVVAPRTRGRDDWLGTRSGNRGRG